MKAKIRFGLTLAFVIGAAITLIQFNTHRPRLLVLHSAGSETEQVRAINRGLRDELRTKTHFSIRWYYTGLSTMVDKGRAETEALRAHRLVDSWEPDVLLAVGDDAQEYVTRHYANHSKIRIVYCAVHEDVEPYGLEHAVNATGVLMVPPLDALQDMLIDLGRQLGFKKPLRILHLGDKSDDVKDDGGYISAKNWGGMRFVGNHYVGTFDDWKTTVMQAANTTDFILTSDYSELARSPSDLTFVPPKEVVAWTVTHSPVPVIGTRSEYVWDGGLLAVGASLYQQGRVAGNMAVRILDKNAVIADIPEQIPDEFVVAAHESKLFEKSIKLPDVYKALARASNNYFR